MAAAYMYGGWFAPKEAGQISIQFLWAQLVFLEGFYSVYSDELESHELLWAPGLVEDLGRIPDLSWSQYLRTWRNALTELGREHEENMPADIIEVALSMSDYTPEQKQQWRQSFEAHAKSRPGDAQGNQLTTS